MSVSILYKEDRISTAVGISEKTLYHFLMDRSFSCICTDHRKREIFFSTLLNLTNDFDEIAYRREVLEDFIDNPGLFEGLSSLYEKFSELQAAQKDTAKEEFRILLHGVSSGDTAKNLLQINALSLERMLLLIKEFGKHLLAYPIKSRALMSLLCYCKSVYEHQNYEKLLKFCEKYDCFSDRAPFSVRYSVNESGQVEICALLSESALIFGDREKRKRKFAFLKKEETSFKDSLQIILPEGEICRTVKKAALTDLSNLFNSLVKKFYDRFSGVAAELVFYDVALRYISALQNKGVALSFPEFHNEKDRSITGMYDLYMALTLPNTDLIIPVELHALNKGMILFGKNGSGKTVLLRTLGTIQMLGQAGLPVPCVHARLPMCTGIFTHFSESEKDALNGERTGRFEAEVRELAATVDALKEGSLVFLNETFQSTAYEEGASALSELLKYFSRNDVDWILVSHLLQLKEYFSKEDVRFFRMTEGYRIQEEKCD